MEFQAYADGTLLKILVGDGETADLGAPIALVGEEGEAVPETGERRERRVGSGPGRAAPRQPSRPPPSLRPSGASRQRRACPKASGSAPSRGAWPTRPASSCRAGRQGLGPRGPHREGRRRARDRRRRRRSAPAAAAPAPAAPPAAPVVITGEDEVRELTPMLKAVAKRMSDSKSTVPPLLPHGRDRHDPRCADPRRAERGPGGHGREDQHQRPHRAGLRDGAGRESAGAPLLR